MKGIIGKKVGMTSIFDQAGRSIACTVVHAQPNVVTQVKTVDTDGYDALQLAYGEAKAKNTSNAMQGHFEKAKTAPKRTLAEFRDFEISKNLGDLVSIDEIFTEGEKVSAIGTTKGKGFQGGMKRWNWKGGPRAHGSTSHRRVGSIGSTTTPGRVLKGHHMPGHMGNAQSTVKNLKVITVNTEHNIIAVKGAVPGHRQAMVLIKRLDNA